MAVKLSPAYIPPMLRSSNPIRSGRAPDASVAPVAALLADPARVAILWALIDGRSLPAGELARAAGVSPSTASSHLRRLEAAKWIAMEQHGRHRYFRLTNVDIARALEALATLGEVPSQGIPRQHLAGSDIRLARSCYDHLAGLAGVALTEALVGEGTLILEGRTFVISPEGRARLAALGIDAQGVEAEAKATGRYVSRACLDWSERRYHLAGALGQALFDRVLQLEWFTRKRSTRALTLTNLGRRALQREFGVRLL